ncbi:MAG: Gfo/Idh/MocA family oxidoreductase [Planctomycetota bacterium]|nr:MAG: Gfo/Idh/MocA family oxidoreductase [Planctomycetota bacterium]
MTRDEGPVRIAVLGLGFMGRTHIGAYRAANEAGSANTLVAVCDADADRRAGKPGAVGNLETDAAEDLMFDPAALAAYEDPAELFANPEVELVSICTHTDSHVDLAIQALEAGKHVLVEKPVALHSIEVERLASAAAASATLCMPAHCMRFWPGWVWLKEQITAGTYGAVRSAVFRRLASPPAWSADFYANSERTGGALIDLHIHDADFIRWCFGPPDAVESAGDLDHLTTLYRYTSGPRHVVAEGGWDHTPGFPFQMRYVVVFEEATAEFDLGRDPQLVLSKGGESHPVELPAGDGYLGEVSHLIDAIRTGSTALRCTIEEAAALARMLEREREQLT